MLDLTWRFVGSIKLKSRAAFKFRVVTPQFLLAEQVLRTVRLRKAALPLRNGNNDARKNSCLRLTSLNWCHATNDAISSTRQLMSRHCSCSG